MIILNPEFHRNLWLKFSLFRLIAMPVLVGTVLAIIMSNEDQIWADTIFGTALNLYFLVVFVWGNFEAAGSISNEYKNCTWDFQRMSSIGPWELSLGKLFGATSYVWYFGLTLLAVLGVAYHFGANAESTTPLPVLLSFLILSGIMGHAAALATSLTTKQSGKGGFIVPFIVGFMVSQAAFGIADMIADFQTFGSSHHRYQDTEPALAHWYGQDIDLQIFVIGSMLFFFFWIILGLQRRMREELQFRNSPIAWTIFCAMITAYFLGFTPKELEIAEEVQTIRHLTVTPEAFYSGKSIQAFIGLMLLTYVAMLAESGELAKYKRFFSFFRAKSIRRTWENTPSWLPVLLMLVPLYIYASLTQGSLKLEQFDVIPLGSMTAALLFLARDAFVVHALSLGGRSKHSKFILVFFYLMMYALLPLLTFSVIHNQYDDGPHGGTSPHSLAMKQAVVWFFPAGSISFLNAVTPSFAQALIAGLLLKISLRRLDEKKAQAKPAPEKSGT